MYLGHGLDLSRSRDVIGQVIILSAVCGCRGSKIAIYLESPTPICQITIQFLSDDLCVPAVRLPTVGRRAFSLAGTRVWNALPADVTSAPSLFTFRKRLKLHLFSVSYPGLGH